MSLIIEARVELSTKVLDFFPNAKSLEEKCVDLQNALQQLSSSIALNLTVTRNENDDVPTKLEISGEWEDIVKVKECLNKWASFRNCHPDTSVKFSSYLHDTFIAQPENVTCVTLENPLESNILSNKKHEKFYETEETKQTKSDSHSLTDRLSTSDLDLSINSCNYTTTTKHAKENGECSRSMSPSINEAHCSVNERSESKPQSPSKYATTSSSRPRRNVQHKILPLLKSKGQKSTKHGNSTLCSKDKGEDAIRAVPVENQGSGRPCKKVKVEPSWENEEMIAALPVLKRGRPRKRKKSETSENEKEETAEIEKFAKRGRGRHCKQTKVQTFKMKDEEIIIDHQDVKRGRGRPRKNPVHEVCKEEPDRHGAKTIDSRPVKKIHHIASATDGKRNHQISPGETSFDSAGFESENEREDHFCESVFENKKEEDADLGQHFENITVNAQDIHSSIKTSTKTDNLDESISKAHPKIPTKQESSHNSADEACHKEGSRGGSGSEDQHNPEAGNHKQHDKVFPKVEKPSPVRRRKRRKYESTNPNVNKLIVRNGKRFGCTKCPYTSSILSNMKFHVRRGHMSRDFKCEQCDKSYAVHKDLVAHSLTHSLPYQCQHCSKRFSRNYILNTHVRGQHMGTPKKLGRKFSTETENAIFSCDKCSFHTEKRRRLTIHVERVHGEKIFKCSQCDKVYSRMKDLNSHSYTHSGNKFKCDICHKELMSKYGLQLHKNVVHFGHTPPPTKHYQCELCGKVSRDKTDHKVHMNKAHLNLRPFKCQLCPMTFFSRANLRAHVYIHGNVYGYECKHCGKKFKQRQGVRIHEFVHRSQEERPFKCSSCDRTFTQRGALTRHKRTHTGERPFLCKFCGAAFNDYSVLRRHLMGTHNLKNDLETVRQVIQEACKQARDTAAQLANKVKCEPSVLPQTDMEDQVAELVHQQQMAFKESNIMEPVCQNETSETQEIAVIKTESSAPTPTLVLPAKRSQAIHPKPHIVLQTPGSSAMSHTESLNNLITQLANDEDPVSKDDKPRSAGAIIVNNMSAPDLSDVHNYSFPQGQARPSPDIHVAQGSQQLEVVTLEHEHPSNTSNELQQQIPTELANDTDMERTSMSPSTQSSEDCQDVTEFEGAPETDAETQQEQNVEVQSAHESSGEMTLTLPEGFLQQLQSQQVQSQLTMLPDGQPVVLQALSQGEGAEHIIVITQVSEDQQPDLNSILSMHAQGTLGTINQDVGSVEVMYQQPEEQVVEVVGDTQQSGENDEATLTYTEAANVLGMLQEHRSHLPTINVTTSDSH